MRYAATTAAALTPPGASRPRTVNVRRPILVVVFVVIAAWALIGYAQEAFIGHRLAQQVADLRNQNAVIAAQNDGYRKDIQAIDNGSANEEEARLNGYSKPGEKVFLITDPPSPSPSPNP